MDEFITEIQNNIGMQNPYSEKKCSRFRELFSIIISSHCHSDIKILEQCENEGDVVFEVSMKSVGISYETLVKYRKEIASDFTVNFLGEFLIRENMDMFVKVLTDLKDEYASKVNQFDHSRFGMKIFRDKFILTFHISLLQFILTEDFKKKIRQSQSQSQSQ